MTNYVSISGTPTSSISNHTKHIDLPRWTKYRLLNEGNAKIKEWTECVDIIKWTSDKKRIKRCLNINYNLMIKVQDWILENSKDCCFTTYKGYITS